MLRGIATVNCYVDDPAAAAAWYSQVLGIEPYFNRPWVPTAAPPTSSSASATTSRSSASSTVASPRAAWQGRRTPAGAIVHWHVDDLEATVARLIELGATPFMPVTEHGPGFVTASVIDPFGNVLGVMTNVHYLDMLGEERAAIG